MKTDIVLDEFVKMFDDNIFVPSDLFSHVIKIIVFK